MLFFLKQEICGGKIAGKRSVRELNGSFVSPQKRIRSHGKLLLTPLFGRIPL
jgi:hypothetical protein